MRIYKNLKTGDAFVIWHGDNFGEVHAIFPSAVHKRLGKACVIPEVSGQDEIPAPCLIHKKGNKAFIEKLLPDGYVET